MERITLYGNIFLSTIIGDSRFCNFEIFQSLTNYFPIIFEFHQWQSVITYRISKQNFLCEHLNAVLFILIKKNTISYIPFYVFLFALASIILTAKWCKLQNTKWKTFFFGLSALVVIKMKYVVGGTL